MKKGKIVSKIFGVALVGLMIGAMLGGITTPAMVAIEEDGTVYDYQIISVTQTGTDEITVRVQARYCPYCNPNSASNPGCTPFTCGYPPPYYPYSAGCSAGYPDGRFVAVCIKDSTGTILGTQKLVCNPTNWPLNMIIARDFVFTGVTSVTGSIIAEADVYCSWCGHWYPEPKSTEIVPLKVCIDPGHDYYVNPRGLRTHIGAEGYDGKTLEVDVTLDVSLRLKDLLEAKGIEVIMTRETGACPGKDLDGDGEISRGECLKSRCDIANTNDCGIFVSIHCNSDAKPAVYGTETFYYDHPHIPNPEIGQPGYGLAYSIQTELLKKIAEAYVPRDRGVK